jgi:hypothetical protein
LTVGVCSSSGISGIEGISMLANIFLNIRQVKN